MGNNKLGLVFKIGLPLLISVVLVVFLYRSVDWDAIMQSLRSDVDYVWFIPVVIVGILSHVFRGLRWRLQLRAIGLEAPVMPVVNSIFATYFINLLAPRVGEVFRVGYISKRENAPFSTVFGTMLSDRLCDTLMVGLITLLTLFIASDKIMTFLGNGESSGGTLMAWLGAICLVGLLAMVWLYHTTSTNKVIASLRGVVVGLWQGIVSIARVESVTMFVVYTLLIWGCYYGGFVIAAQAFTLPIEMSIETCLVLFVFSSLGMAVPSNGGLGPWQYAVIFGFALYGLGSLPLTTPYNSQASAFAMLVWGVQTLMLIVLGIYSLIAMWLEKRPAPTRQ